VLDSFDGVRWTRELPLKLAETDGIPAVDVLTYDLTLEPHDKEWVFALDLPLLAPGARPCAWI